MRANIHAQISLALNRIYTEWYPSKGYPFNITSSTSYDQAYVSGRDIFEIMSRITDDIFNTYVRKPGTLEPYFTEYCDGKQVTCKGMKQWDTVKQANAGKNALQILRVYYPNVEIVRTDNIAAVPESYPGTPLREGSTGADVRTLQRWLNRIAKDYPFFGTVTVDGVFGASTTAMVKKFQKQFSLAQDGIVGRSTWYKISYIYVAVKKLAELTSEGEKPDGNLVAGQYPGSPLRLGSRGDNVEQIQFWLNQIGKFVTTIPSLAEDGIFGAGTERAVRAFQQHFALTVDGVVGAATWAAIYAEYNSLEVDSAPPAVNRPGQYPGTALRIGDKGESVRQMQFYLRIIARSNSAIPSIATDGIFGNGTRNAVIAFQNFYGLGADGVVGMLTWNKIYEVYTDLINGLLSPSQRPGTYPGSPLLQGDSGIYVKEMQYYLYLLSAYYSTIPQIAYDGRFGPATTAAVRAFQTLVGITVDGIVGKVTWDAIYARFSRLRNIDGPTYAFNPIPYPGRNISIGAGGSEVFFVQYLLLYIGFFYDSVLPVIFDGSYSNNTAEGVSSFQALAQLPITGIVDENTWNALVFTWLSLAAVSGEPVSGNTADYPGFVMQLGSAGVSVAQLQTYMNGIAERFSFAGFVPNSGIFEEETDAAVRAFQQGFGLPITGIVERSTWDAIYNYYSLPE
ncbi:MAG: peptidoglycan-binding protein [Oscillospiraceae bacterium]